MINLIKEVREFRINAPSGDSRTICGTPIVFNSTSNFIQTNANGAGFYEVIAPEAFTAMDIERFDIRVVFQHNDKFIPLARSKRGVGTLRISIDTIGVNIEFDAKNTAEGESILQAVRSGDLDAMSFAFYVNKEDYQVSRQIDKTILRTINRFEDVSEFSIVNIPAYSSTIVSARAINEELEPEIEAPEEVVETPVEAVEAEAAPEVEVKVEVSVEVVVNVEAEKEVEQPEEEQRELKHKEYIQELRNKIEVLKNKFTK